MMQGLYEIRDPGQLVSVHGHLAKLLYRVGSLVLGLKQVVGMGTVQCKLLQ